MGRVDKIHLSFVENTATGDMLIDKASPEPFVGSEEFVRAQGWQGMDSAPKGENILVWFDHDADPYRDPQNPTKLTPYAAWAEGGDFLEGNGFCIAKWWPKYFETEDDYGSGFWMPAAWFAFENGDWERVCNPIAWMPLPSSPSEKGVG